MSGSGEPGPRKLRVFFALWPSDRQRAALAAAAAPVVSQVEGQRVPPGNLHVTLAFLGSVPGKTLARLVEVGGLGPWPVVRLAFERLEYWARPKVLVAMPGQVPATVADIVDRLWRGLEPHGFPPESRPWRPHLTLVRHVRRPPPENLAMAPVEGTHDGAAWRLALVGSVTHPDGPRYKALADWPLS